MNIVGVPVDVLFEQYEFNHLDNQEVQGAWKTVESSLTDLIGREEYLEIEPFITHHGSLLEAQAFEAGYMKALEVQEKIKKGSVL